MQAPLKVGVSLRYAITDAEGTLLLNQGALVTERLKELLEKRGVHLDLEASLVVEGGDPEGLSIPLRKQQITIGRRPECDIRIDSGSVSGLHCRLLQQRFGLRVVDLDSRNGTFLNGTLVVGASDLSHGDLLKIASTSFRVQIFAALHAETSNDQAMLQAWIRDHAAQRRPASSPYAATLADIDLG
ncbi:MAG: FHA domain-containing protein [Gemmataceae bacterium]